ncbi:hypothetical protein [Plasmodium yoelii yoelii]|uniref:Uncharacterized protein n=1 Tax=Plasmodium yoelii yoelii TaxID=73239 RepID=Q7RM43_PLAYO|nr:hypothetical protein [Plasmodium yoelii yoelii]
MKVNKIVDFFFFFFFFFFSFLFQPRDSLVKVYASENALNKTSGGT